MSESRKSSATTPLQRQNAHDSSDSKEESGLPLDFAEVTVASEYEERSEAVRLLPVAGQPRRLINDALHRRNHSVGEKEEKRGGTGGDGKDAYRKCSEGNQMTEPPARKSLSESRGVQLDKIELVHPGDFVVHRSQTAPGSMGSTYVPTMTETPLGYSLNESLPPMTANEQSTVHITIQFSYPNVVLPEPYQMSENSPQPTFVPMVLPVQGGKLANAEFLLHEVSKEFDVDSHYADEALAIWMISDLLELQLKPHHSPYEVGCCWAALLKKFSAAPDEDIAEDKPLVMVKRRVQLSVRREQEIITACPRIREILFNDAYESFMMGRYNPSMEEAAVLAGLAMSAAFEPFCREKHGVEFLRQEMESFVPRHLVSAIKGPLVFGRAINGPNSLESLLLKSWREAAQTLADVHLAFLEKLHDKPYYGAAFFPGSIERPKKKWSLSGSATSDVTVLVGINEQFLTVLNDAKKEILLVQRIRDCSWNRIDPKSSDDAILPSLLVTFPDENAATRSTKVLQIFGRQAVMMNALLNAMKEQAEDELEDSGAELSDSGADYTCSERSISHLNGGYSGSVPSTSRSGAVGLSTSIGTTASTSMTASSVMSTSPPKTTLSSGASSHSSSGAPTTVTTTRSSGVSRAPSITRSDKMCLATFDQRGKCLQAQGSLKVVFKGLGDATAAV